MLRSPLRYAGGKSKAHKHITPHIPLGRPIVSPFIGGGSLEVAWSEHSQVIASDAFYPLTNFWETLLADPHSLADTLSTLAPNQETYKEIKEELLCWDQTQKLLSGWSTDYYKREPQQLDALTASAYFFHNHNLSYGPAYLGWMSGIYENQNKWDKSVERVRNFTAPNLSVSHSSYEEVVAGTDEFLYLDPPYLLNDDEDNSVFTGLYPNRNFPVLHNDFTHEVLRDLLHDHKGGFVLSYNDTATIREWYSDFTILTPEWSYSFGAGETRREENKKKSKEVLVIKDD